MCASSWENRVGDSRDMLRENGIFSFSVLSYKGLVPTQTYSSLQ